MSLLDLKPLSETTIQELGLEPHDLWMLKIGDQKFGPFETLSLRHYAVDNKTDFDGAFATHYDVESWKYFQNLEEFRDIFEAPPLTEEELKDKGTWFWMLVQGQLSLPLTFEEIEKKIELGILSLTDAISMDEGENWEKIHHMEMFAHRLHSSRELPNCPKESDFAEARIKLLEKMEIQAANRVDNIPNLVYLGQKTTQIVVLKIDEIKLESLDTEVSSSMKWAIPSVAMALALVMGGFFFYSPNSEDIQITDNDLQLKRSISGGRSDLAMNPASSNRRPSSVRPFRSQRSSVTRNTYQESSYPTHIETHQQSDDPQHEPAFDEQPTAPQTEESLVMNNNPEPSLDAAMSGEPAQPQLEQPQVEEVSDF